MVTATGIDSVDQHTLRSKPRGGVDGLGKGMIDEFADIERGLVFVPIDAKTASTAEHVVACGVAYTILHDSMVLGAVIDLVDVVGKSLKVIGMDARFPAIATVVYVLRRKSEIAQGVL